MEKKKPQIRFNGFEGEWVSYAFRFLFTEKRDTTQDESEDQLLSCAIDGIYLNSELFNHFRGSTTIGYLKVKRYDLILSAQNLHLGNANVNLRFASGIISPAYKVYTINGEDPYFINAWVKSEHAKSFFMSATTEGASLCRKNIEWEFLYDKKICIPSIPEQEKIGVFLTTLDKLIAKLEAKLDKLRKLKQALLDKMFINVNGGGYEAPQIRFKGYTDKWQVKDLGEVAIFNPPNQPLKERFYYIDLESVEKGSLKIKEQVTKRMAPSRAQRTLEFNDILFQTVRPYLQNHYLFKKKTQNNQWVASTGYALLRPKIYPELLYTMLLSKGFMQEIMLRCTGSTYPAINSKKMIDIKVGCSSVQMEQQLIGDLFILLDDQLNKTSTKLTKLRNIKQSFVQKMFA